MMQTTIESEIGRIIDLPQKKAGSKSVKRDRMLYLEFMGLDGLGKKTLQSIGEKQGMSRERVRQIVNRVKSDVQKKDFSQGFPGLDDIAKEVLTRTPSIGAEIEKRLVAKKLIPPGYSISAISNICPFITDGSIAKEISELSVLKLANKQFVVGSESDFEKIKKLYKKTKSMISMFGMIKIDKVCMTEEALALNVDTKMIEILIKNNPYEDEVIEINGGWFFYGRNSKNRVVKQIDKVFGVFSEVPAESLLKGLLRSLKIPEKEGKVDYGELELMRLLEKIYPDNIRTKFNDEGLLTFVCDNFVTQKQALEIGAVERQLVNYIQKQESKSSLCQTAATYLGYSGVPKLYFAYCIALNQSSLIIRTSRGNYINTGTELRAAGEK